MLLLILVRLVVLNLPEVRAFASHHEVLYGMMAGLVGGVCSIIFLNFVCDVKVLSEPNQHTRNSHYGPEQPA